MITVTWTDGNGPAEEWVIDDGMISSLDKFRQAMVGNRQVVPGKWVTGPRFETVKDMIVGVFMQHVVRPCLEMFPPPEIVALEDQAKAAQTAAETARSQAAVGILRKK